MSDSIKASTNLLVEVASEPIRAVGTLWTKAMGGGASKAKKVDPEESKEGESAGGGGGFFSAFSRKEYVDPPMPNIGKFVDFDRLETRKKNVKHTMKTMFKVIEKDCMTSIEISKEIPVSDMIERVKVTDPIMDLIRDRKSKKEDRQFMKNNLLETQRYLSLRRTSLDMMNHNYDDLTVKELETVYVDGDARANVVTKEESHLKEVEEDVNEDFEPYSDTESMMSFSQASVQDNKKNKGVGVYSKDSRDRTVPLF